MRSFWSPPGTSMAKRRASGSRVVRGCPEGRGYGAPARDPTAAAGAVAVDGCHGRLAHRLEQRADPVAELAPAPCPEDVEAVHVLDVRPGDEGLLPRSREHDRPHGL